MPRFFIVAYTLFFLISDLTGQVYHFETGKILPIHEPNQIVWKQGVYNNYPADYGTLIVKENTDDRTSRLINIPIIRIKAAQSDSILNPIFLLNGGPGESNFQPQLFFDELTQHRDLVLVGYRGVDGSVKLDCPCMKNVMLSDSINLDNYTQLVQLAVDSCFTLWKKQKIDIKGYSMNEVVNDIEATRNILGYDTIDFLAFSYGTMLSQLYYSFYPKHVQKMALIGARPLSNFLFDGDSYNKQIFALYNHYSRSDSLNNEQKMANILSEVELLLENIIENDKEINPFRFLFFGFSKLYSMNEIEKVFSAYSSTSQGNFEDLNKLYNEFYKNFPGNIVIGDIILKKQGWVVYNETESDTTIGHKIVNAVNSWYSPEIELLKINKRQISKPNQVDSVKVLFISGEFDVASPADYLNDTHCLNYTNTQKVLILNSGHLDLFEAKNKQVKTEVLEFLK